METLKSLLPSFAFVSVPLSLFSELPEGTLGRIAASSLRKPRTLMSLGSSEDHAKV